MNGPSGAYHLCQENCKGAESDDPDCHKGLERVRDGEGEEEREREREKAAVLGFWGPARNREQTQQVSDVKGLADASYSSHQ